MTPTKNEDFITCGSKTTGRWNFRINSSATHISETVDELCTTVKKLWSALEPFYCVTKCGFAIWVYEEDIPLRDSLTLEVDEQNVYNERLENERSITAETLCETFHSVSDQHPAVRLAHLKSQESSCNIRLGAKDRYISQSDTEFYKREVSDGVVDEDPYDQLLEITVNYHRGENENSEKANMMVIGFTSHSDIWFAETEQGAVNRQRLASVLQTVYEEFDVVWASFSSEITTKDTLTEQGMTELVFN